MSRAQLMLLAELWGDAGSPQALLSDSWPVPPWKMGSATFRGS